MCRCFIEQIPSNTRLAYIFNPKLTVEELLLSICDEFRIALPPPGPGPVSVKSYVDAINADLLASHARQEQCAHHRRGAEPVGRRARNNCAC
ncbi:hypothetical protein LP420_08955 [Massilia sp. B-10]|nr:hypothetical protein LP420_08955 [Massilia sp. B-10]